jgi:asparagine synthase (glutamine-hydrolysing)
MCGIAGSVRRSLRPCWPPRELANAALACLRHRGPDAQGEYRDGSVWLGHVRLSILDLSDNARQPMATPDGRFVISYNGEVYNYRDLASELGFDELRSSSDTEVVLRACEVLGVRAFRKFSGIFALALYDRVAGKLWLVRDRLGVKPLYYRVDSQGLTFASEIKAITTIVGEPSACDLLCLHEWLYYGCTFAGRTLHEGIRQLLPGHYLELDLGSFAYEIKQYWSLERAAIPHTTQSLSPSQLIVETRRLVEQAVRRQLVSDVPVGVFLSGGIDSSAITAFASKHYAGRLATYSAAFDGGSLVDERPKARRIAHLYGTDHHELQIAAHDVGVLVERMVRHHDMPFSDAANIPLYAMATQISSRTKVVLQGDGGDELFGGYRRYATLAYHSVLRPLARIGQHFSRVIPTWNSPVEYRVQRYLHALAAEDLGSTMARLLTCEDDDALPTVFSPDIQHSIQRTDPFARYRECQRLFAGHDVGNQMSLADLMIELPDRFLEKVDRATMAASLEVRVPFLDDDLVQYVVRIPGRQKMPWGRKKWLLKQALAGIVPHDILYAPKTGLTVPISDWLRTSLKPMFFDHLSTFTAARPGVLNADVLVNWYSAFERRERDYSNILWKMLNFMTWCNNSNIRLRIPREY